MRSKKSIIKTGMAMFLSGILLSACSLGEKLRWLDDRSGDVLEIVAGEDFSEVSSVASSTEAKEETDADVGGFTKETKAKIDDWLQKNNLNRYGDPIGTNYEKGTPLIDEMTGENIDRFDYVLERVPDLSDLIKQL